MSFQLYNHGDGGTGLIAVCDVCKKRVKAENANLCWVPDVFKEGESYPFKAEEMRRMEPVIHQWGQEAVAFFEQWRKEP